MGCGTKRAGLSLITFPKLSALPNFRAFLAALSSLAAPQHAGRHICLNLGSGSRPARHAPSRVLGSVTARVQHQAVEQPGDGQRDAARAGAVTRRSHSGPKLTKIATRLNFFIRVPLWGVAGSTLPGLGTPLAAVTFPKLGALPKCWASLVFLSNWAGRPPACRRTYCTCPLATDRTWSTSLHSLLSLQLSAMPSRWHIPLTLHRPKTFLLSLLAILQSPAGGTSR